MSTAHLPDEPTIQLFSNSDHGYGWTGDNCDLCWRSPKEKPNGDYSRGRCALATWIYAGALPVRLARRLGPVTRDERGDYDLELPDRCPLFAAKRPKRERRPRGFRPLDELPLFESLTELL